MELFGVPLPGRSSAWFRDIRVSNGRYGIAPFTNDEPSFMSHQLSSGGVPPFAKPLGFSDNGAIMVLLLCILA